MHFYCGIVGITKELGMRDKLIKWLGGYTEYEVDKMFDKTTHVYLAYKILEAKLSRENQPRDSKGRFVKVK